MSLHRFAHLGDLHLAPGPRNVDRLNALDQAIDSALELEELAAWLWPGDLNHARMSIDDRNALVERLRKMADRAPVVIVAGNHDLPGDLDVFAKLATRWPIHVIATPTVLPIRLATGSTAAVFCLPYPTRAGLVAVGTPPGQLVQEARRALEVIFFEAAAQLQEAQGRGEISLMVGHVNVAGAITSVGQPNIGVEIELDSALLMLLGPIYKGLNHIHLHQRIGGAWYPGSLSRLDWGECEPKGYLVVDVDDSRSAPPTVAFRPLDVPAQYHVEADRQADGWQYRVTRGPGGKEDLRPSTWRGHDVRVRYTFAASQRSILDTAPILAEFAEARRLELEPVAVTDRGLRAPAVAAARTLTDKLRAWCAANQQSCPDSLLEKLTRLERGEATQVLSDVTNAAAAPAELVEVSL